MAGEPLSFGSRVEPRVVATTRLESRTPRAWSTETAAATWRVATILLTLGALVLAIVLAPSASASPARGLVWLLFLGSSVHVASTGWLYTLPEVRSFAAERRGRYIYAPILLVTLTGAVAAAVPAVNFTWLLLAYFGWQLLHFQKQNLGMAALAASSRGIPSLRRAERGAINAAGAAGILALLARPSLVQLSIEPGLSWLRMIAVVVIGGALTVGLLALAARPRSERPATFCVVYLTSLAFVLPVFVFASPYAAVGGMTIAHGVQYLLLLGLVAVGRHRRKGRLIGLLALCNVALIGGIALNAASHLHGGGAFARFVFGAYLGAVMAHFVIDAGLWRLRDRFPRRFLSTNVPFLVPGPPRASSPTVDDRSVPDIC